MDTSDVQVKNIAFYFIYVHNKQYFYNTYMCTTLRMHIRTVKLGVTLP